MIDQNRNALSFFTPQLEDFPYVIASSSRPVCGLKIRRRFQIFFFFSPAEDRPIKHLIQPGPGVSLCPAKQYNHLWTVQCAGGRETFGAHLPADSTIRRRTTLSIAPVSRGCPSPCRCRDGETVMDYSRFSNCFLENLFYRL